MTEIFTNQPATTVPSAQSTASTSWTVTSSASFPAAATGVSQFHVADPAAPSEIVAVTNVSGNVWTVTRGAEGTTPLTHATGFTVVQVITAGWLNNVPDIPVAVAEGGTGDTVLTTYTLLAGGTAATSPVQQVPAGTSGQFLVSGGSSALPSWQAGSVSTAGFLADLTGTVNVGLATAPTTGQVLKATSSTTATWQTVSSGGNTLTRALWTVPSPGATYTASTNELTAVSTSSGSGTVFLPTAPAAVSGTQNAVKQIILGSGNQVTIQTQGSDVFSFTGGATTSTLTLAGQAALLQYDGTSIWTIIADDLPASQIVILGGDLGNTSAVPLVESTHLTVVTNTAASGTVNLNATTTRVFNVTQSGAATYTFTSSGLTAATAYGFEMYLNPGTFTTAWPGSVTWLATGTAPTLTASAVNTLVFETVNQGTTWYGAAVQNAPALPLVVADGGTGAMAYAPYAVITGGTGTASTSTGPLQNVSGVGSSGQLLTSNGPGALPAWQESPGVSGVTANSLGLGLLTMQPHAGGTSETIPAQDIVYCLATAAQSQTVTTLGAFVTTAGVTTGTGINGMALYTSAGTLLQYTNDMSLAFQTVSTYAEGTLGTAATLVQGVNYYICVAANFTGTTLHLAGQTAGSLNGAITLINGNCLCGAFTAQTSWPGSFTPSAAARDINLLLMYAR